MPAPSSHLPLRSDAVQSRPTSFGGFPASRTKDISCLPLRLSEAHITPWGWRFWTQRLTPVGRWLVGATTIFLIVAQSSLDVQFYVYFMYLVGLWVAATAAALLVRPRAAVRSHHAHRIGVGETLTVDLEVTQQRRGAFVPFGIVPFGLPWELEPTPHEGAAVPPLRRGETGHVRLQLRCLRRGMRAWRGFRLETDYPFGILRAYRNVPEEHRVLVYPQFTPLVRLAVPTGTRYHPGGVAMASNIGNAFEYIGNRDYRDGDNVRSIDWRATARLQTPIVREYREEYFLRVGVVMDTFVPKKAPRPAFDNFERAISACASVCDYMARSDYIVDLFAAGPNLYHLTAGRSLAYLDQILDILACVETSDQEPFDKLEPEVIHYLSRITTIICVFMNWDDARRSFVERLRREGAGVKVIVVRDDACTSEPDRIGRDPIARIDAEAFGAGVKEL